MILYHGTNCDFDHFDVSMVQPYNVGIHFGTMAAARARIDYLREHGAQGPFRLIKCQVDIRNPFRIDDVFGHSYAMILDALQQEVGMAASISSPLRTEVARLIEEYIGIEDDPNRAPGTDGYVIYRRRLDADIARIFSALGHDGLVYENELEDAESIEDSYVVFDPRSVVVVSTESIEMVDHGGRYQDEMIETD